MAAAEIPIQIAELCGGEKDNAIPIEAHSILYIPLDAEDAFKEKMTEIDVEGDIPQEVIDAVLSEKCFDGKSFLEIEKDVTVTVIY